MLRRVPLIRTDVPGERIASIIKVTRIGELGTVAVFLRSMLRLLVNANDVPSSLILVTLMMEAVRSSETSFATRTTPRNFPEHIIFRLLPSFFLKCCVN
jgi:hypothetical protein